MMPKFSLQDFLRSLLKPFPARDWSIALAILLLIFVALAAYAGYLFWGVRTGTVVETGQVQGALPKITRGDIADVLETYRTRRVNFEAGNFPLSEISDPVQ